MIVQSSRLGALEVPEDKLIRMARPILGFEQLTTFCLIEQESFHPFFWLQSVDDPDISFIVVNPTLFCPDYHIEVHPNEIAELKVREVRLVETYVIVTIPENSVDMSINLQGPILINTENGKAKQLVLVNSEYHVQHLISDLMDRIENGGTVKVEEVAV